jgi:CDGSH-type Zn-finger protein
MKYKPQVLNMEANQDYVWTFDPRVTFRTSEDHKSFICTCGQTKTAPYCDGSHTIYNANLARGGEQGLTGFKVEQFEEQLDEQFNKEFQNGNQ